MLVYSDNKVKMTIVGVESILKNNPNYFTGDQEYIKLPVKKDIK